MQRWPACSVSLHMTPLTLNAACSRRCVDTSRPHVAAARKDKSTPCMRVRSSVWLVSPHSDAVAWKICR
jgi:hypothetical protein